MLKQVLKGTDLYLENITRKSINWYISISEQRYMMVCIHNDGYKLTTEFTAMILHNVDWNIQNDSWFLHSQFCRQSQGSRCLTSYSHIDWRIWHGNDKAIEVSVLVLTIPGNSSPPGQNGCHFADGIFRCIFVNEKFCTLIKISLKFVPKGSIENNPALV